MADDLHYRTITELAPLIREGMNRPGKVGDSIP
jgi:hypothetical protein